MPVVVYNVININCVGREISRIPSCVTKKNVNKILDQNYPDAIRLSAIHFMRLVSIVCASSFSLHFNMFST